MNRHHVTIPTNPSSVRQHLALIHIDSSSSDENDSDFESLVSSNDEENPFFDFADSPSKVEYEVVDRLDRHHVTVPTNASFVRERQKQVKLENYDGDDEEEERILDHFDIHFTSSEEDEKVDITSKVGDIQLSSSDDEVEEKKEDE